MKQAIVLLSGGLDSTVTLYYAVQEGYAVKALTVHYGQLHEVEIQKAQTTAQQLSIDHIILPISLPWKGSALLDQSIQIPEMRTTISENEIPATYVPARNTIFLALAVSWAEAVAAEAIFIGANEVDYSGYPDCRTEYFKIIQRTFNLGTKEGVEGKGFRIEIPLITMSKKDIIRLGNKLNVPFEHTWSCYKGGVSPCNVCDSCILRQRGFEEAGLVDPLVNVTQ